MDRVVRRRETPASRRGRGDVENAVVRGELGEEQREGETEGVQSKVEEEGKMVRGGGGVAAQRSSGCGGGGGSGMAARRYTRSRQGEAAGTATARGSAAAVAAAEAAVGLLP